MQPLNIKSPMLSVLLALGTLLIGAESNVAKAYVGSNDNFNI